MKNAPFHIALLSASLLHADETAELAKKLANPVASLISAPIQANFDHGIGVGEGGTQWKTNIQPVIPISINDEWNVISRTILPIMDQNDIPIQGSNHSGVGDILQSFFFSPKSPTSEGIIWGVGPAILMDSASESELGSGKWAAGPTAVALKQEDGWTYGILANHLWSFAGDHDRTYVNSTYLQPFLAYVTKTHTTLSFNTESTYDWNSDEWTVPLNAGIYQMFKIGDQILQLGGGVRYYADTPEYGARGWGSRFQLTFLFPTK